MKCIGITKSFRRCKNESSVLIFCHFHKWQGFTFLFSILVFIGLIGGIYHDVVKPINNYLSKEESRSSFESKMFLEAKNTFDSLTNSSDSLKFLVNRFEQNKPLNKIENEFIFNLTKEIKIIEKDLKSLEYEFPQLASDEYKSIASHLKIVDAFVFSDSIIEFKLKNSGNDAAFIKGIQFAFGQMSCGSNTCSTTLLIERYKYELQIIGINHTFLYKNLIRLDSISPDIEVSESIYLEEYDSIEHKKFIIKDSLLVSEEYLNYLKNLAISEGDTMIEYLPWTSSFFNPEFLSMFKSMRQKSYFSISKSPILRVSQTVYPKDVDRFQVTINVINKESFLPMCIDVCYIEGYAIILFDENQSIVTNKFEIKFDRW